MEVLIEFRGMRVTDTHKGTWVHGMPAYYKDNESKSITGIEFEAGSMDEVDPKTVGQLTGVKDKNENKTFSGDKIAFYILGRHVQQSHPDINPEIDEAVLRRIETNIIFHEGCFTTQWALDQKGEVYFSALIHHGLPSIEFVKDHIFGDKPEGYYTEEEMTNDMEGTDINDSILGFEVIGNIHQPTKPVDA